MGLFKETFFDIEFRAFNRVFLDLLDLLLHPVSNNLVKSIYLNEELDIN